MNSLSRSLPALLRSPPPQVLQSASSVTVSSDCSSLRYRMPSSTDPNSLATINRMTAHKFEIPIVGYEVIEERARFTVFKLRIQNTAQGEYWFIFRRYTDFVRLLAKIKCAFPNTRMALPRKRWFGDNFDPRFLDDRTRGLQVFVNTILRSQQVCCAKFVRDFFCLDEPPSYAESVEESRAIFESLEETISHLRVQIRSKDEEIEKLRLNLAKETKKNDELSKGASSGSSGRKCVTCDRSIGPTLAADKNIVHIVTAGGDHGPATPM